MEDITDSEMTTQLMERMCVDCDRASEVVDALVKTHGRKPIDWFTHSDLIRAAKLADNLKAANESN